MSFPAFELTFNQMLQLAGLDLGRVRLLRHSETPQSGGQFPYDLWRNDASAFDKYNAIQKLRVYQDASFAVAFVVTPAKETLLACVYQVIGDCGPIPSDTVSPVSGVLDEKYQLRRWQLERIDLLKEYEGKIVIDWGGSPKAWCQHADKPRDKQKKIIEIRQRFEQPPFPGWDKFRCQLSEINTLYPNWKDVLSVSKGIYLLVHQKSGKQYVGSAFGVGGFWGRWEDYVTSGHGGNRELKKLGVQPEDLWASVLETARKTDTEREILVLEHQWMEKLGSKAIGLNAA